MKPETRQQTILTAASRLFHQHGFRKVTMSDIAEAAGISRPTLYAAFPNKEAIFGALVDRQAEHGEREGTLQLADARTLEEKLTRLFEIWIVLPAASAMGSVNGLDLLSNAATYAPAAVTDLYARFERQLTAILKAEMRDKRGMAPRDLAHIMTLATRGLKASSTDPAELRRMVAGLIAMAVATARS